MTSAFRIAFFALALLVFANVPAGAASAKNPLEPEDTSSPRSTLFGFITIVNDRYAQLYGSKGVLSAYLGSTRLYPTEHEYAVAESYGEFRRRTSSFLDTSQISEVEREHFLWRFTVQLKEILDRVELPAAKNVPDAEEVARTGIKRWFVPGTRLRIDRVASGTREGEWLFSGETVANLPEDYEAVKSLPYLSRGSEGFYNFTFHLPTGLAMVTSRLIPPRWFWSIPDSLQVMVLDQPMWRWIGLLVVLSLSFIIFWAGLRLAKRMGAKGHKSTPLWELLPSSLLMANCLFMIWFGIEIIRISPKLAEGYLLSLWTVFFLTLTYFVWLSGGVVAEWLIAVERIQKSNIDGQVIRLTLRIMSLIVAISVLVEGANRIGLPSYSVVAGLGVGGLAAALAGQQAIANLIGSLIIMFEKPFRVGHQIKTGEVEGTVEDVGFRCTLVRTPENTFLSVPSSILVTHTIENLTLRKNWRVKRTLYLEATVAPKDVAWLIEEVRTRLNAHPDIKSDKTRVALTAIGLHGFEITIDFHIKAIDERDQMQKCHYLFLEAIQLAESRGIAFKTLDG